MPDRRVPLVLAAMLAAAGCAAAAERPRICVDDLPEGAHLPPQPGCDAHAPRSRADRPRPGDGVSVRISGRVSTEFGARR